MALHDDGSFELYEGEFNHDTSVKCPYCGYLHYVEDDPGLYDSWSDFECENCGEMFLASADYSVSYNSKKREEKK